MTEELSHGVMSRNSQCFLSQQPITSVWQVGISLSTFSLLSPPFCFLLFDTCYIALFAVSITTIPYRTPPQPHLGIIIAHAPTESVPASDDISRGFAFQQNISSSGLTLAEFEAVSLKCPMKQVVL